MNWDAVSAVAEIFGTFAVVVTLIYVAIQIRQSNRESQSSTAWAITNSLNEFAGRITANSELASVWNRGIADFQGLDATEQERFVVLIAEWYNVLMALYRTRDLSPLPDSYWKQAKATFLLYMDKPGFREAVMTRRVNFEDDIYIEIVESYEAAVKARDAKPTA